MNLQNTYDVGIYCRLSRDDNNGNLESMSIANQRTMLCDYVREKGWEIRDEYIDDGYSGTNFDRPDFKRLQSDILAGRINCVITKDLSRLGRNYAKVGYYTDEFFVENSVRFIAINDSYDSLREEENEIAPFKNVLNEWYPRDISKKVRQVKKTSAQQGKFMGSQAPYGYKKSPENKHVLVIDPFAAAIMRRIFREFASGDSARAICDKLNQENIDSPRFYFAQFPGGQHPKPNENNNWGSATVMQMLKNQAYIGNMVQGKRKVASFKTKKCVSIDPERWIVVEGTHEPLIDMDTWKRVQKRIEEKGHKVHRRGQEKEVALFAGILKCADCGSNLAYTQKQCGGKAIGTYRCSRYTNNGKTACSTHLIKETSLIAFVLNDIRYHARLAHAERELLARELSEAMNKNGREEAKRIDTSLWETQRRLDTVERNIKSLYEDKCAGKLPEAVFASLLNGYVVEQETLTEKRKELYKASAEFQKTEQGIDEWLSTVEQYTNVRTLDRVAVTELIDKIIIGETHTNDEDEVQEITIVYRFIGDLLKDEKKDIA